MSFSQFGQGNVIVIADDSKFQPEIQRAGDRLVVVDFTASWCGPCQTIAPIFAELSMKYPMAVFLKVDINRCEMTAALCGISAMPTFQFFKNRSKVDEIKGANPVPLENKIKQWIGTSTNTIIVDPHLVAAGRSFDCFDLLLDSSPETFMDATEILIKFANNIINHPTNPKYRSIRVANKTFQAKLLPVTGGVECLFNMGFEEQGDNLVMPMSCPLENLRALRDALYDERTKRSDAACGVGNVFQQPPVAPQQIKAAPSISQPKQPDVPQDFMHKEKLFYQKMKGSADHVMFYEDPELQRRARALIPIIELQKKAKTMNDESKEPGNNGVDERDCLLLALLTWYKVSGFFQWMDKPKCGRCNIEGQSCGYLPPLEDEERWGAARVEGYICPKCGQDMRFPRYNHPGKLLETRCGRCGEWANVFTLFCRAVGFEARYVLDWTDHVWTEVYSVNQKRWLHVDACEGICDKPLIYESGWNKKLTYIIAFSKDEIVDVTWRYSAKHEEVRKRRLECSEDWLFGQITMMTKERQKNLPDERKQELQTRFVTEMVDFLSLKSAKDEELQGRTSGSLKWRQLRGEAGAQPANKHVPYIFQPTDKEVDAKSFRLRYCCASDKYYRILEDEISNCGKAAIEGCMAGMASVQSVFRKVEHDWKMVYLARVKNSLSGTVTWKVDFTKCGLVVDSVTVKAWSNTFENGQVLWKLAGDKKDSPLLVFGGGKESTTTSSLSGSKTFTLTAELSGGKGDVAWQHAQLFRQSIDSYTEYPLDILITLKDL